MSERKDEQTEAPASGSSDLMRLVERPWMMVVLVLHLGCLGIPLYWKTGYSRSTRLWICILSIVYTVAAVVFIILMLRWISQVLTTL